MNNLYICIKFDIMFKNIFLLFILSCVVSSCVLPSKFQKITEERNRLMRENASLHYLKEQSKKQKEDIVSLKEKLEQTEALMYEVNSKLTAKEIQYKKCEQDYNEMLRKNKKLLNNAFAEKNSVSEQLAQQQQALVQKEKELQKLERDLNNQKLEQKLLKTNLESRQKHIDSLSAIVRLKDNKLAALKSKIKSILVGYSNDDIKVEKRNDGRLYISMSQNLLFAKGSDKLDIKGEAAIRKVAEALKTEKDFDIVVEGHTDSDGNPKFNWALSTRRALAVVNVLENSGVLSQKIIASGRGQYRPIEPNDSEINKARNRRTEIILEPNFNEILNFIK